MIGGWTDPTGSRVGLGAILVGYYDAQDRLRYAGKVGTGFSNDLLRRLHRDLASRDPRSPIRRPGTAEGAHWARPELVGTVAFTEWTADGRLRHPELPGTAPRPKRPPKSAGRLRDNAGVAVATSGPSALRRDRLHGIVVRCRCSEARQHCVPPVISGATASVMAHRKNPCSIPLR